MKVPKFLKKIIGKQKDVTREEEESHGLATATEYNPTNDVRKIREAFECIDKDGDGLLSASELQAFFLMDGEQKSLSEAQDDRFTGIHRPLGEASASR